MRTIFFVLAVGLFISGVRANAGAQTPIAASPYVETVPAPTPSVASATVVASEAKIRQLYRKMNSYQNDAASAKGEASGYKEQLSATQTSRDEALAESVRLKSQLKVDDDATKAMTRRYNEQIQVTEEWKARAEKAGEIRTAIGGLGFLIFIVIVLVTGCWLYLRSRTGKILALLLEEESKTVVALRKQLHDATRSLSVAEHALADKITENEEIEVAGRAVLAESLAAQREIARLREDVTYFMNCEAGMVAEAERLRIALRTANDRLAQSGLEVVEVSAHASAPSVIEEVDPNPEAPTETDGPPTPTEVETHHVGDGSELLVLPPQLRFNIPVVIGGTPGTGEDGTTPDVYAPSAGSKEG